MDLKIQRSGWRGKAAFRRISFLLLYFTAKSDFPFASVIPRPRHAAALFGQRRSQHRVLRRMQRIGFRIVERVMQAAAFLALHG